MRLPEPPSPVENVGVLKQNQMNPIAYVNQVLQKAQAAKMVASHTYVSNLSNKYHGCLLRVGVSGDRSGSWFVDARFPSRQDARKAVCLYALSCGEFDSFVRKTVERRTLAVVTELLGPIEAECIARRLPTPEFTLTQSLEKKKDITATVTLRNAEGKIRSHSVNGTYFVHLEAKLAVLQLAMKNNILSFIRTAPRPDLKGVWPNPSNHPPLIRYGAVTLPVHPQLAFENRPSALSYVGTAKARPQASREDDLEDGELMEE
ncbi:hypothetical protein FRB99_002825 [Tulasnella sp. 403]|nr:hypothetical protein FRB99_002825 [Tulasnella sp. 403]